MAKVPSLRCNIQAKSLRTSARGGPHWWHLPGPEPPHWSASTWFGGRALVCKKSPVSKAKIEAGDVIVQPNEPLVAHPRNGNSNSALAFAGAVAAQSERHSPNRVSTDF